MKIKLIYSIMFILMLLVVNASTTFNYPNYFDVNVSEQISIISSDNSNESAFIFLDGVITNFTKYSSTNSSLYIIGDNESDKNFIVEVYNESLRTIRFNNTDNTRESFITIDDGTYYGWVSNATSVNHTINDTERHVICPLLQQQVGNPKITVSVGEADPSNVSNIIWYNSTLSTIIGVYDYQCIDIDQLYIFNHTNVSLEYFVFTCNNCDNTNKLRLSLDTTTPDNNSFTMNNLTDNQTFSTSANYMITVIEVEGEPFQQYMGTFKFRIPFYMNIDLYNDKNSTLQTNFDYVYLKKKVSSTTSISGLDLTGLGNDITNTITFGSFGSASINLDEVFWGAVINNTASIKLYEKANYTVHLLSVKTFLPNGWVYEFIKPQYTNSKIETTIDDKLEILNEVNQSANILLSEYEANKSGFYFNIFKWIVVLILFVLVIVVSVFAGDVKAFGVLISIWLLIIKLMGLNIII